MIRTHLYRTGIIAICIGHTSLAASWPESWSPAWGGLWNTPHKAAGRLEMPPPEAASAAAAAHPFAPAAEWDPRAPQPADSAPAKTHDPQKQSGDPTIDVLSLDELISVLKIAMTIPEHSDSENIRRILYCIALESNYHHVTRIALATLWGISPPQSHI